MVQFNKILDILTNNWHFVSTLVVLTVGWLLRRIIHRLLHSYIDEVVLYHRYKKVTTYFIFMVTLIILVMIWSESFMSLTTFLGLLSAGVAIALRDLLSSIAAWLFIISRKPFSVGDRIQIGDLQGDVIDLRIFQFTIMEIGNWVESDQSTGRIIHVPNHKVMTDAVANYTAGFEHIWNEIKVTITLESDWKRAKSILNDIIMGYSDHQTKQVDENLRRASKKYMIYYKKLTPIVYMDVVDYGIRLTVRYLCRPKARRTTVDQVWTDVLNRFEKEPQIDLAYPTQRITLDKQ